MTSKEENTLLSTLDVTKLRQNQIILIFGVTKKTVMTWVKNGCPREQDKSYDIRKVIKWREARLKLPSGDDAKRNEEILKLKQQNEKLALELEEKKGNTITRERLEEILTKMASELMAFLKGGYKRSGLELWNNIRQCSTLNDFLEVMDGFVKQAMDAFTKSGEDI